MAGIEEFIKKKTEFKENYKELKNEPRLISVDGPDGVGKTSIINKMIEILKKQYIEKGKNPDDIIKVKYTNYNDSNSQRNLSNLIRGYNKDGSWDDDKINQIIKTWSTKLNRSYNEHILQMLEDNKTVILDRSEIDLFRACLEWNDERLLEKSISYFKDGTLTSGIAAGNRIFISSSPQDAWDNLEDRRIRESIKPSVNDPKSLEETEKRKEDEEKAEEIVVKSHKEIPNVIKIKNERIANDELKKDKQIEDIAREIVSKLRL